MEGWAGKKLMITHCSAHRLQLCCSDALTGADEELKDLEKRIRALFRHLKASPAATIDLLFWSDLTGEEMVSSMGTSTSRWLSLLQPVERLHASYLSVLAHLHYVWKHHAGDREQRKVIQWIFLGLSSWQSRLTLACLVDVLRLCYETKNRLENCEDMNTVRVHVEELRSRLTAYAGRSSALAAALTGEGAIAGTFEAEKVCRFWREQLGKQIMVQYEGKDQTLHQYFLRLENFTGREHVKKLFQRIRDYAIVCCEKVASRFSPTALSTASRIFGSADVDQAAFQAAVAELAGLWDVSAPDLLDELRTLWGVRATLAQADTVKMWCQVMQRPEVQTEGKGSRILAAHILAQTQSASCERSFALTVRLKDVLGKDVPSEVIEQYLVVTAGACTQALTAGGFFDRCLETYLAKERREGVQMEQFRLRGNHLIRRKRAVRKDKGVKRPTYRRTKKWAGLRSLPNARQALRNAEAAVEVVEALEEVSDMYVQMSPLKRLKLKE